MTGYYRARSKNKQTGEETLYAVAYWWHNGQCFCRSNPPGTTSAAPTLMGEKLQRMIEAWPYVSKEPIEYDVYQSVLAGNPWPDQHVVEKAAPAEASNMPLDAQGSPSSPVTGAADQSKEEIIAEIKASPAEWLKREIEAAAAGLPRYVKKVDGNIVFLIDSDEMNGAAQSLRAQLLALSSKAEKARLEANRPHQEAIKRNGMIWSPLADAATLNAHALRDGPMKAWEVHKREQAAAAVKATQAAQAAQVAAGATNSAPVQVASNAPAPSAKIKGATGKAASVGTVKIAVIHNQDQVYAHFKNNEQVKAILQGLANASVRASIEVPGTTVAEDVAIK